MIRKLFLLFPILLPQPLKRFYYRTFFGWKIGPSVWIGMSFIDSLRVELGEKVRIGHFNQFRNMNGLKIGSRTYISNFNEFSGARGNPIPFSSEVTIGSDAYIMSHHYIDV